MSDGIPPENTRDAILDATDRMLAKYGYGKMTIEDLARDQHQDPVLSDPPTAPAEEPLSVGFKRVYPAFGFGHSGVDRCNQVKIFHRCETKSLHFTSEFYLMAEFK
ncbi:hypothetical protein BH20ACI2_BH20ACI2_00030 [soil metagenome]